MKRLDEIIEHATDAGFVAVVLPLASVLIALLVLRCLIDDLIARWTDSNV